jgi:hypothetical protein
MQALFQKLLKWHSDGWNQTQKEAMVDLCLLGMYSDDLISLAEQDFMEDESTHLQWESGISFNGYLQRTIPKIRAAKDNPQTVKELLQNVGERLGNDDMKRKAGDELEKLLAADGIAKIEQEFLAEAKAAMGI